jgi:hypothetical protein
MLLNSKVEKLQDLPTLAELRTCEDALSKIIIIFQFRYPNQVHSTVVTLIIIKFPMISEVLKYFPSENGCILDVHNMDEKNSNINSLFDMTKWSF